MLTDQVRQVAREGDEAMDVVEVDWLDSAGFDSEVDGRRESVGEPTGRLRRAPGD